MTSASAWLIDPGFRVMHMPRGQGGCGVEDDVESPGHHRQQAEPTTCVHLLEGTGDHDIASALELLGASASAARTLVGSGPQTGRLSGSDGPGMA